MRLPCHITKLTHYRKLRNGGEVGGCECYAGVRDCHETEQTSEGNEPAGWPHSWPWWPVRAGLELPFFPNLGHLAYILCWDNLNPYSAWRPPASATGHATNQIYQESSNAQDPGPPDPHEVVVSIFLHFCRLGFGRCRSGANPQPHHAEDWGHRTGGGHAIPGPVRSSIRAGSKAA